MPTFGESRQSAKSAAEACYDRSAPKMLRRCTLGELLSSIRRLKHGFEKNNKKMQPDEQYHGLGL